jgi:hypothetical protein
MYGGWKTATIASGDTASGEVDLGRSFDFLDIILPTLDSGTVKLQVSDVAGGTYQDLGSGVATATTTGGYSTTFNLGGWQHIKVVSSASQGAARSIKVRGWSF